MNTSTLVACFGDEGLCVRVACDVGAVVWGGEAWIRVGLSGAVAGDDELLEPHAATTSDATISASAGFGLMSPRPPVSVRPG
jgi:hypothetical protein